MGERIRRARLIASLANGFSEDGVVRRRLVRVRQWTRVALGCILLVSCAGAPRMQQPPNSVATPSAEVVASPPLATPKATPASGIGEIVWAASSDPETNAPVEEVTAYQPDAPRITAFAFVSELPAGSTIDAAWAYNDTSLDAFSRQIILTAPAVRTWISFHIDRAPETPWPTGIYEIAISLNGTEVRRAAVEVTSSE